MYSIDIECLKEPRDITQFLKENKDDKYRDFTSSLIPSISKDHIIGVRTPVIRALAKSIKGTSVALGFLNNPEHYYLEEKHLHGFLIEYEKDFEKALCLLREFLPHIDNWSTCDCVRPKIFKTEPDTLYEQIKLCLQSDHTYTVRYGIGLLNSFYLDDNFSCEHLDLVCNIKSDEYYINMMVAWYFATALTKQYTVAIKYIEQQKLAKWTHNKAIQKACESLRIDNNTKDYLRTLKIK